MNLDLTRTPFSRNGSYFAFSYLNQSAERPAGLYLRTAHGGVPGKEVFRIGLVNGDEAVSFTTKANATVLTLEAATGHVAFCIAEPGTIRASGSGVGLRLDVPDVGDFGTAFSSGAGRVVVNHWASRYQFLVAASAGEIKLDAPWETVRCRQIAVTCLPDSISGGFELTISEYSSTAPARNRPCPAFDECANAVAADYRKWAKRSPKVSMVHDEAGELAAYVAWSSVVAPAGNLTRPAMLMSKNWMANVWCWDACFNAMALSYRNPEAAWDQFMLFFDNQDANGALPDSLNDAGAVWSFAKPPIHGWALRWMMERADFITKRELRQIYEPLARWTVWWMTTRDDDNDGIPQYNHGNDSGWDNATVFDGGVPVESPDLSAFLIIQMDVLADIADELGRKREARQWKKGSDILLEALIVHSWKDEGFVALLSGEHTATDGDCLLSFVPLVLGKRLPKEVRKTLVAGLIEKGRFLTPHGLATESPLSTKFDAEGYWRGPIWAPATLLIVDGLVALGERGTARQISKRFCDMVLAEGMSENFNAKTGKGLCDPAYTWTASVFQILAHEYV